MSASWSCAYTPTVTRTGVAVKWKPPVKLNFNGNPANQSFLNFQVFFDAVATSLQRWKAAADGSIEFDYRQGTDPHDFPTNSDLNGISSIYFASSSIQAPQLSPNVLGMTQVWYNIDSGEIQETDIVLNDRDFYFTNNPKDTSGYGASSAKFTREKTNVYVQNVITHELGHALGLSHSGGLQSTMLFMESPEQAHLGCDDLIGIHALYPSADEKQRGTITGLVRDHAGKAVLGAHVLAISQRRGTVLATSVTNKAGKYSLGALEAGHYFIMVEPFFAGPLALPAYFAELKTVQCPNGAPFNRGFLTEKNRSTLLPLLVNPNTNTEAPPLTTHCAKPEKITLDLKSLSTEPIQTEEHHFFGIVDDLSQANHRSYHLFGVSGRLELFTLSYGLYSPIHPSLSLSKIDGTPVPAEIKDPVYVGDSGFMNQDSSLSVDHLPYGDYLLKISTQPLQANSYPAGPVSLDATPFIVITGSLNEENPPLLSEIPSNARCRMKEDFPPYHSPTGGSSQSSPPSSSASHSTAKSIGFCGTALREPHKKSGTDLRGPPLNDKIGWFIPWLFLLFYKKQRKVVNFARLAQKSRSS